MTGSLTSPGEGAGPVLAGKPRGQGTGGPQAQPGLSYPS